MSNRDNEINNVRPTSRFETYDPKTETQTKAMQTMQKLADGFVALKDRFAKEANPFPAGALFVLSGGPGRGKSHLLEALVTDVAERAPNVMERMFLLRKPFSLHMAGGIGKHTFGESPIVLIDDLFSEHQSLNGLHSMDVKNLSQYIAFAYENRIMTIATCNFPFMNGILAKIEAQDTVGRISSRCAELVTVNSGEFAMDGPDHRRLMAEQVLLQRQEQGGNGGLNMGLLFGGGPKVK